MKKLLLLGLVAFVVLWGQSLTFTPEIKFTSALGSTILRVPTLDYHQWYITLDSMPYTAENPLKIEVTGTGYIAIHRDGNEVLRIYSDEEGIESICKGCSDVRRLPNGLLGMSRPAIHVGKSPSGDTRLVIRAGDEFDDSPTTGDTWVTTKGDPSTATTLFELEEKK